MKKIGIKQRMDGFVLSKRQMGVLLAIILFPVIAYGYNDTIFLIRHSINVWGSMFEGGGILEFYAYNHSKVLECQELGLLAYEAVYDFPIYIIMAIWNFPLYLIQRLTGIDMASVWLGILYCKLLFVLFLGIGAMLIHKICLQLGLTKYKADWGAVIYLTSILTFGSVYMIGQSDSIGIAFMLAGILYYLRDVKKKFLLFFAFAISMKYFSILVFAVLLLAKEKRILYLIKDFALGISVTVLSKILFHGTEERAVFLSERMERLLLNKLPLSNGTAPVCVFFLCFVLVCCYLSKRNQPRQVFYRCFTILFLFFASFFGTPYWYLYLVPFLAVIMVINQRYEKEIVILTTVGEVSLTLGLYTIFYWCYDVNLVNRTLAGKIFGEASYADGDFSLKSIAEQIDSSQIFGISMAVFLAVFTAILVEGFFNIKEERRELLTETQYGKVMRGRIAFHVFFAYLPILVYFINRIL